MVWVYLIGLCVASSSSPVTGGPLPARVIYPSPCLHVLSISPGAELDEDEDDRGGLSLVVLPQRAGQICGALTPSPHHQHPTYSERSRSARAPPRA